MRVLQLNLALRVAALYALFGGLWILFSDRLLLTLATDPYQLTEIQSYKGWGFVAASTVLIYLLLRHELKQRLQVEKELCESEQRFREIVENAQAGYFFIDAEGYYRMVNQAWLTMHGYDSAAEVIGQPFSITQVETDLERARMLGEQVLRGEPISSDEFSRRCKDGSIKFHAFSSRPVIKEGQVIGLEGFMTDITERKRIEETLRQSEAKYRSLFENSVMGISQTRPDGLLVSANAMYARMYGYANPEELLAEVSHVGQQLYAHPEDRAEVLRLIKTKGVMEPREIAVVHRDGTRFFVLVGARAVRDAAGNLLYYQAEQIDITERKRAELHLAESAAQLRALSQRLVKTQETERRSIAREIHDEFGQALTALKIDLSWLAKRLPPEPPALREKVQTMAGLLNATMQMVRRIATELRPGLLDDLGLLAAIEWQAQEFTGHTGIVCDLRLGVGEQPPPFERDLNTAIFRIFQESLTNVARYAQATRVQVEVDERPDLWVLTIADNGQGITVAQITSPQSLGLMGMRERACAWGGEVTFEGRPNGGTTVTVVIPYTPEASK